MLSSRFEKKKRDKNKWKRKRRFNRSRTWGDLFWRLFALPQNTCLLLSLYCAYLLPFHASPCPVTTPLHCANKRCCWVDLGPSIWSAYLYPLPSSPYPSPPAALHLLPLTIYQTFFLSSSLRKGQGKEKPFVFFDLLGDVPFSSSRTACHTPWHIITLCNTAIKKETHFILRGFHSTYW